MHTHSPTPPPTHTIPLQLRVWSRVLSQDDVKRNMWRERPDTEDGLAALYIFDADGIKDAGGGGSVVAVATDRSRERRLALNFCLPVSRAWRVGSPACRRAAGGSSLLFHYNRAPAF